MAESTSKDGSTSSGSDQAASTSHTGPESSPSTSAARRIAQTEVKLPPNYVSTIVLVVGLILLMLQGPGSSITFLLAALCFAYIFAIGYMHLREGRAIEGWTHLICAVALPPIAILIPVLLALMNSA